MKDNRIMLSRNEVDDKMTDGEYVHTFTQMFSREGGTVLLGIDLKRDDILDMAEKYGAELSGPEATKMDHGVAVHDGKEIIFCETKSEEAQ